MEALTLSRKDYDEGLSKAAQSISASGQTYAEQFSVTFPDGLNNPSALEVCRIIQNADLESKIRLTKIMIADKNVEVHCPNGDVEKFHLSVDVVTGDSREIQRDDGSVGVWKNAEEVWERERKKM